MIAQTHQDQLNRIKSNIERGDAYFKPNNERFHEFQKFVFYSAITLQDETVLKAMGKPVIEFNILNAFISRLCGEFSKQEPSIYVSADDGAPVDPETLQVVEGHIRHILFEAKKNNTQYNIYKDQISGGFSSIKIWTEYAHEMSFDQVIKIGRVFEPTLTGYDPNARLPDKSDAEFAWEIFPIPLETFKKDYPDVDTSDMSFNRNSTGFSWAYSGLNNNEKVVIVCQYYEKKTKKIKIMKLSNNKVMTEKEYEEFLEEWKLEGHIEVPPAIIGKPRWTQISHVDRYKVIGCGVIDYESTDFKNIPLKFVDGDSVILKMGETESYQQFTKPYVFHAKGMQRLSNFAGQVVGNDFEMMTMHKWKVAKESIPQEEEYQEGYENPARATTLVYNQYIDGDPDKPLNPPQEIARVPLPPEVLATFNNAIGIMQNILGSYDASLGINDNQLSGIAVVEGATQSNATAMPYIVSHMVTLTSVANDLIYLFPKYYKTPRTIPVISRDGKRSFVKINSQDGEGVTFNYDENALQVKVEAGVSFSIAKNQALQQLISLMRVSPLFAQFMNEEGLDVLLENVDFKGNDIIKSKADAWMAGLKEKMAKQAEQPNPQMIAAKIAEQKNQIESMKLQADTQLAEADMEVKSEQVMVEKAKADNERLDILLKAGQSKDKIVIAETKAHAEEVRARADLQLKIKKHHREEEDQHHRHMKEMTQLI